MRSLSRTLLLIALLMAILLPQGGWVLCIESDGHVAIEAGNVSGRCTDGAATPIRSENLAPVASHCGDCLDFVIEADETRLTSSNKDVDLPVICLHPIQLPALDTILPVERLVSASRPPTRAVHLLNVSFLL
jgi:hypothetical protein